VVMMYFQGINPVFTWSDWLGKTRNPQWE
jgi:hypothetical protein